MLDIKFVRDNMDSFRNAYSCNNPMQLDDFKSLEEKRRAIIGETETLKGQRNNVSKQIMK